jgi:hypothetical protein
MQDTLPKQQQQQQQQQRQQVLSAVSAKPSAAVVSVPQVAAQSANGISGVQTRKKCIVCMDALRDVLLLPCKHLVLCSGCAQQMEGRGALDSCPYCRQACVTRVRVHQ